MQTEAIVISSVQDVANFIDRQPTTRNAWLVVVIALGGVFIDAYDFASLGIGVVQLKAEFHLSPLGVGSVTAMMAVGAFLGAIFGGWYTDKVGRYKMFVIDLVLLVVAAVGASLSVNVTMLLAFRFLLGVGIGLDFPVALSFISEFVSANRKGASVNLWQPMWYVAASCTGLVILPFYYLDFGPYLWRIAVGFGAVPALIILLLRTRFMDESAIWSARNVGLEDAACHAPDVWRHGQRPRVDRATAREDAAPLQPALQHPYLRRCFVSYCALGSPFVIFYMSTIYGPTIFHQMGASSSNALIYIAALQFISGAGTLIPAALSDRIGRRPTHVAFMLTASVALFFLGEGLSTPWLIAAATAAWFFGVGEFAVPKALYG